ncbi:uncharacterized protein JCM15063_005469 [Sporobolomyces koalae]|uniref:uncharacterized protein n=1 Tax=Sporobolomyces koalae TaxID=500713 RepID=UPI00317453AA
MRAAVSQPSPQRRPSSTDKTALLAALANELRSEKLKTERAARDMLELEQLVRPVISSRTWLISLSSRSCPVRRAQIEQKHTAFLAEQDCSTARIDHNNLEVARLRSNLARVKAKLDEAQNVQDDDALIYFSLLDRSANAFEPALDREPLFQSDAVRAPIFPLSGIPAEFAVARTLTHNSFSWTHLRDDRLLSPAPFPRATSSIKGPVSPHRLPPPSDIDADPVMTLGQAEEKGWAGKVLTSLRKRRG